VRGVFVTGTGTGVGKTVVAGAIAAALCSEGATVAAFKPVLTGLDEPAGDAWPRDHELLARVTGQRAEDVAPWRFGPAVSPHLAAELAGVELSVARLAERAQTAAAGAGAVVVEGVGGLLVPLTRDGLVRDLAVALGLPLVIAASPGLGTISHTLMTLEAARGAGLRVAAVVLTPWPPDPGMLERSNRDTIARLGAVEVATLPAVADGSPASLAAAASAGALPVERWCGEAATFKRTAA
jgi:dethiobiotin synthetase